MKNVSIHQYMSHYVNLNHIHFDYEYYVAEHSFTSIHLLQNAFVIKFGPIVVPSCSTKL